jgi:hypothetical protein
VRRVRECESEESARVRRVREWRPTTFGEGTLAYYDKDLAFLELLPIKKFMPCDSWSAEATSCSRLACPHNKGKHRHVPSKSGGA